MVDLAPRSPLTNIATSVASQAAAPCRDRSVDTTRAALLVIVVALHTFMVGVSLDANGAPILENAMEHWTGWPMFTWIVQVMPLFFVLGGFASFTQYTRLRANGVKASAYIASRLQRLLIPSTIAIGAVAVFLAALSITGVSPDVIATAGFRIGQPFWFLAVYIGATALVPAMVWLHERSRWVTLAALAIGAVTIDIVRISTGIEAVGIANLAFVWLFNQQLGFAMADGSLGSLRARTQHVIAVVAVAVLAVTMLTGFYPTDLYAALNPPMGSLVLVGIAQAMIFTRLRSAIAQVSANAPTARVVGWINERSMTIYSWHMLVTIAIAGALIHAPFDLPAPVTSDWWQSRPLWFAGVGLAVFAVTALVGRFERRRLAKPSGRRPAATVATLIAVAAVILTLMAGSQPAAWVITAASLMLALALVTNRQRAGRDLTR